MFWMLHGCFLFLWFSLEQVSMRENSEYYHILRQSLSRRNTQRTASSLRPFFVWVLQWSNEAMEQRNEIVCCSGKCSDVRRDNEPFAPHILTGGIARCFI